MSGSRSLFPKRRGAKIGVVIVSIGVFTALYAVSYANYLLFHGLAELFSIVIAGGVFLFAWNTRSMDETSGLANLGIAYLFIAFLDLMHTLSYAGMTIFPDYDYYANQIWVVARGIEATALFLFAAGIGKKQSNRYAVAFVAYGAITAIGTYLVYVAKVFPVCFVPGEGQTTFKLVAELAIIAALVVTVVLLRSNRSRIDVRVYRVMMASTVLTILGEIAFTVYISNYGISNMVGHFAKIASFYLIYKAIIETGLRSPMVLLFDRLKKRERELEEANAAKARLFSIIAHDLKGPIGAVASFTEILYEEFPSLTPEEQRQVLTDMHNSAARSLKLLEELMIWARNQTGGIEVRPTQVAVSSVIADSVDAIASAARQKAVELRTGETEGVLVWTDRSMLTTVLRNLLSNSVKFTPRGGSVSIDAAATGNGRTIVTVVDTGVGIPESIRENLFRVDKHTSMMGTENEQGTGFGLILCKELVEKNRGTIDIGSEVDRGTTVRLSLPTEPPDRTTPDRATTEAGATDARVATDPGGHRTKRATALASRA
jgi:signal transduction histidine kinase